MKLVSKLTMAFIAALVLVLTVNGYLRIERETSLLHADRVNDHALVGHALGAAVAAVWHSNGREDALHVIEGANERAGRVRIRWMDAQGAPDESSLAALAPGQTWTRISGTPSTGGGNAATAAGGNGGSERRLSYTSVTVDGNRLGFVELSEPLDAEHRAARTIVIDALLTTLTMILVCGALAAMLGMWLVGQPVRALCARARLIGQGDFAGDPLPTTHNDELGLLAREMNAMCTQLDKAKKRVVRETAARITALEQLRHVDRLTTIGTLASGVAHELGTPLNVVCARAKMIASGKTTVDETTEYAKIISDAGGRMTKIIRQLLAFARRKTTHKAACDLRAVATETIELLKPMAQKAKVQIELAGGGDDSGEAMAEVDGDAIQQVLTNIFVNAIHAMPRGGKVDVRFSNETREEEIGNHPGEYLLIRVRDEGEGIAAEHLTHIFEPFFTTKEVGSGTGLGLSVTHGIIEDHGGFIEVESEVGKGTIFSLHLPVKDTTAP